MLYNLLLSSRLWVPNRRLYRPQHLAANFIHTDAEFPRELSRDGPGSRFPAHLVDFPNLARLGRTEGIVPEVLFTSPTDRLSSLGTNLLDSPLTTGTIISGQDSSRTYTPYTPPSKNTRQPVPSNDKIPHSSGTWISTAQTQQEYKAYNPPAPPLLSITPPISNPQPQPHTTTKDNDNNSDIITQAIANHRIYFPASPPTPPSSPLPGSVNENIVTSYISYIPRQLHPSTHLYGDD